jgi:hypothetical protein
MKMLAIMCREQFEDEVLALFGTLGITGYTVIHGVCGSGETGAVSLTHPSSERNRLLLVALDDDRMATLVQAVRRLQPGWYRRSRATRFHSKPSSSPADPSCNTATETGPQALREYFSPARLWPVHRVSSFLRF